MRQTINFNDDERAECWDVAKRVTKHLSKLNNDRYNRDQIDSGGDPYEKRYMAMLGEMAVAKFLELPFETERKIKNELGTSDGELNGLTYNVKSTRYKNGWLFCPGHGRDTKSDLYISVYVPIVKHQTTRHVELVGWLWHNEICKPINISNEFKSKPFVVKTGLRSIFTLADETWTASEMQSVNQATHCAY